MKWPAITGSISRAEWAEKAAPSCPFPAYWKKTPKTSAPHEFDIGTDPLIGDSPAGGHHTHLNFYGTERTCSIGNNGILLVPLRKSNRHFLRFLPNPAFLVACIT